MAEEPINAEPVFDVTDDDKLWAALCWVPAIGLLVALIVLLMEDKKDRPFIKYHAVHSLSVMVAIFVLSLILVGVCLGFIVFFIKFYWAYQAYEGKTFEIPVVTDFIKKQGWI